MGDFSKESRSGDHRVKAMDLANIGRPELPRQLLQDGSPIDPLRSATRCGPSHGCVARWTVSKRRQLGFSHLEITELSLPSTDLIPQSGE